MDHKAQHWVPNSYLAAWCDPATPEGHEPYVWVFPKDGQGEAFRKSPRNLFKESEMYTVIRDDGTRDLGLEQGLARLEDRFATIRRNVLKPRAPVSEEDKVVLGIFTSALLFRTPKQREHNRRYWEELRKKSDWINSLPDRERLKYTSIPDRSTTSISDETVRAVAAQPMQTLLIPMVDAMSKIVSRMSLAILETDDVPGFIASDAPAWIADPEIYEQPPWFRSLTPAAPRAELNLPVSPTQCLHFNWAQRTGYIDIPQRAVDEGNRFVRAWADQYLVVCRETVREKWFRQGEPPPGSWEQKAAARAEKTKRRDHSIAKKTARRAAAKRQRDARKRTRRR